MARTLRALTIVYLLLPLFALAAGLYHPRLRSPTALGVMAGLIAVFVLSIVFDHRRLRRGSVAGFVASRAFAQIALALGAAVSAGVAFGLHGDTFLLLPVVVFMVATLFGNPAMIWRAWVLLVAGVGTECGLQLPAYDAVWTTVLFAGTAGVLAAVVDEVVRGSIHGLQRNRRLAELATETSAMADWPRDLGPLGARLASIMDVGRYAVLNRLAGRGPIERVFAWPDDDWPSWEELSSLPQVSLDRMQPMLTERLLAAPARAGTAGVVVVVPASSTRGSPLEPVVVSTVAGLLAAMLLHSLVVSGLVEAANTDELTGLANRRRLFEVLEREMSRARRSRLPLSVAMIDLDHFKRYNDTFGHAAGDALLQHFALRTTSRVRAQDLLSRYGGEEFCLVLPETDLEGATSLVEGLRKKGVATDRLGRRVTFSAGLATWDANESSEELVFRADANLYRAKAAGRNRVAAAAGQQRRAVR